MLQPFGQLREAEEGAERRLDAAQPAFAAVERTRDAQAPEFGLLHIGREVGDDARHVALEKTERERAAAREIPFERRDVVLRLDRLEVGVAAVRGAVAIGTVGFPLWTVRACRTYPTRGAAGARRRPRKEARTGGQ